MTLDDIEWNPEATGVGSMLMVAPGLPTDEFGHPYQPLFWFAGEGILLGLVVDADDHVLAWGSRPDASAPRAHPPEIQRECPLEWWDLRAGAGHPGASRSLLGP